MSLSHFGPTGKASSHPNVHPLQMAIGESPDESWSRNSFSIKLGTSGSSAWKITVYFWEISLFFGTKMRSQVIQCQYPTPWGGRCRFGPQNWAQAMELPLWGCLSWRSQILWSQRIVNGPDNDLTGGSEHFLQREWKSHCQAFWELGWILLESMRWTLDWKGWNFSSLWVARTPQLKCSEGPFWVP